MIICIALAAWPCIDVCISLWLFFLTEKNHVYVCKFTIKVDFTDLICFSESEIDLNLCLKRYLVKMTWWEQFGVILTAEKIVCHVS